MPDYINDDELPVMRLEDLPMNQVLDTLATSCCRVSSSIDEEEDDDIEGLMEDYPVDDLNFDDGLNEELEPDDEDSDEDGGDFEYDTEED